MNNGDNGALVMLVVSHAFEFKDNHEEDPHTEGLVGAYLDRQGDIWPLPRDALEQPPSRLLKFLGQLDPTKLRASLGIIAKEADEQCLSGPLLTKTGAINPERILAKCVIYCELPGGNLH